MDFIRPIGPAERDIDPAQRVERLRDERERREQQEQKRKKGAQGTGDRAQGPVLPAESEGPVEGDDGHLHIDIRA